MTGSSSTKRKHGFSVGLPPQPKSILEFARAHKQEARQKVADEKIAGDRLFFYANLKKNLNDRSVDIATIIQKYNSDLAKMKKKTKVPESKARILAEKNLAKQRKSDKSLKTDIEKTLPKYLGAIELYQTLYSKRSRKTASGDLKGLIYIYFHLYKEMARNKLQTNIYDFIASMEDTILNFHAGRDD